MEKARDCGAPCFSGSQQHSQALWPRGWSWGAGEACVGPKGLRAESDFPFGSPLWGCFCGGGNAGAWEGGETGPGQTVDGRRGQKGGTSRISMDTNQCLEGCEGQQGMEESAAPPPPPPVCV